MKCIYCMYITTWTKKKKKIETTVQNHRTKPLYNSFQKSWSFCSTFLFSSKGCLDPIYVHLGHTCGKQWAELLCCLNPSAVCCFHNDREAVALKWLHSCLCACVCVFSEISFVEAFPQNSCFTQKFSSIQWALAVPKHDLAYHCNVTVTNRSTSAAPLIQSRH